MVWRMIKSYVPMLGNDFRKMYLQLKGKEVSRAETCYSYTSKILSNLLGALFIRKRFSAKVKTDVSTWTSIERPVSIDNLHVRLFFIWAKKSKFPERTY